MSTREERLQEIERSVFKTITDADWARQLPRARAMGNAVREKIGTHLRRAYGGSIAGAAGNRILDVTSTQESREKTS